MLLRLRSVLAKNAMDLATLPHLFFHSEHRCNFSYSQWLQRALTKRSKTEVPLTVDQNMNQSETTRFSMLERFSGLERLASWPQPFNKLESRTLTLTMFDLNQRHVPIPTCAEKDSRHHSPRTNFYLGQFGIGPCLECSPATASGPFYRRRKQFVLRVC